MFNSQFLRSLTYNELKMLVYRLIGHVKFGKVSLAYKLATAFIIWLYSFYLIVNIFLHTKNTSIKFFKFISLVSTSCLINRLIVSYICRYEEYQVDKFSLGIFNDLYSYKMLLRKLNYPLKLSLLLSLISSFPSIEYRLSSFK